MVLPSDNAEERRKLNDSEYKLPTLVDFEQNKLGTYSVATINGSPFWNESENFRKLNDTIVALYNEVAQKLGAIAVLRAVVITSDVIKEYDRLLEGTVRKARIDVPREGLLGGKVLKWGKCETEENYYAAIVIDERICIDAFENDNEGKALIVHEFTHVAEGFITRKVKGSQSEDIYTYEWEKIKYSKAATVFSEYFAQIMAYPYYPNKEVLQEHINHAITFLKSVNDFLNGEIEKYRRHADMGRLWPIAIAELSRVFDQIGRSIGLLVCIEDDHNIWNNFLEQIEAINPLWVPVIQEFMRNLSSITNFERYSLEAICEAIEIGFKAAGIIPEVLENGNLYIHVPE